MRLIRRFRYLPYIVSHWFFKLTRPIVHGRVLFASDSRSTLSGNFEFVADYLDEFHPEIEIVTSLKPGLRAHRRLREAIRLTYDLATSETVLLDDYYPIIYALNMPKRCTVIQLWHAAGAFKRVGWSRAGLPGGPSPRSRVHRGYTTAIASAEAIRSDIAEGFKMPISSVRAVGVPRTDEFFDTDLVARHRSTVRHRYRIPDDKKLVLFAPTFRGNGQLSAHYDLSWIDWTALVRAVSDEFVIILKLHPFVALRHERYSLPPSVIDASQDREITELLCAADMLITDYSSAIFEYALLRRPMAFFCPDAEEYQRSRDFYYPFDDYLCGPVTTTTDELAAAIEAHTVDEAKLKRFLTTFMSACDGNSTRRVVEQLILHGKDRR